MMMQLKVVSKLLKSSSGLLASGYLAFTLCCVLIILLTVSFKFALMLLLLNLILIGLHHFLSIRVQFDAALLDMVSQQSNLHDLEQSTQSLDQSLVDMKLMPASKSGRAWETRLEGCVKLFKFQIFVLCLQYLAFICIFLLYN